MHRIGSVRSDGRALPSIQLHLISPSPITNSLVQFILSHCLCSLPCMAPPRLDLASRSSDRAFFGHPRGLSTLFFTEMWERFSYYGMRALLILFMTAPVAAGGLGFDAVDRRRDLRPLHVDGVPDDAARRLDRRPADRPAPRRALRRHPDRLRPLQLAVPSLDDVLPRPVLIVIGTGLLKGNISVIVGRSTRPNDIRRDAGFSIFYMGINLGAFVAPLVCGYLGAARSAGTWGSRRPASA